jgi:hypothetical protein
VRVGPGGERVVGVLAPVGCRGFSGGGPPGGVPVVVAAIGFAGGDDKFKLRITNDRGTDLTLVKMTCGWQLANSSRMCCAGLRPRSFWSICLPATATRLGQLRRSMLFL